MITLKIPREVWLERFSKNAHLCVFEGFYTEQDTSLFDYATLSIDEKDDKPVMYSLVREVKKDTILTEYGGSFPEYRGSIKVRKAFESMKDLFKKEGYLSWISMVRVDNATMQHCALYAGFRAFGMSQTANGLCLEYRLNLKEEENK